MTSFDYAPLDQSTRSIRLLRFEEQSTELDLVCCSLETHKLDHCPPYAALSYVWGEAEEAGGGTAKGILVDGRPFLARPNLHAALCAISDFEDRDRLWIKTSMALSDFTSYQTDLPDLMTTLKSYTPKHRWQAVVRKVLRTNCVMIRNPLHRFNHVDRQLAHWDIFQSIMGYSDETCTGGHLAEHDAGWIHRYYWIDAICIDQENDLERGHQVGMMGDIYGGASRVIAWLGSSSAGAGEVMPAATEQTHIYQSGGDVSLKEICDHPYWNRLWTAQEYILARHVLLVCGRRQVPLGEIEALTIVRRQEETSMSWRMGARKYWRLQSTIPLDMLLEHLAVAPCSDPRDRVYGLLSLLGTQCGEVRHLQPDYTISARQLYYRVLGGRLLSASTRTTRRRLTIAGRRAILRLALDVADNNDFKTNDLLYQVVECAQEQALELNSELINDPQMASHREVLRGMSDSHLAPGKRDHGGQDALAVYSEVTNIFSGFPKEEDPLTWGIWKAAEARVGPGVSFVIALLIHWTPKQVL